MQCGECKGSKVILDRMLGEYYCGGCGAVTEDSIADFSDLSFTFTGDEGSAHHSITSFLVAGKGLGTPAGDIMKQLKSLKGAYLESQTDHVERSFRQTPCIWLHLQPLPDACPTPTACRQSPFPMQGLFRIPFQADSIPKFRA